MSRPSVPQHPWDKNTVSRRMAGVMIVLILGGLVASGGSTRSVRANGASVSAVTLQQVEALIADKAARTPAQQKVDSNLLYAIKQSRGEGVAGVPALGNTVQVDSASDVVVDIVAPVNAAILDRITALGGEVQTTSARHQAIRARLPLDQVEALAAEPQVTFVREKDEATTSPSETTTSAGASSKYSLRPDFAERASRVQSILGNELFGNVSGRPLAVTPQKVNTSEGDATHRADQARTSFGVTGAGIKIGVLSDGVDSLAAAQASGDLPANVTVLPDQARAPGGPASQDEGTAMLEIVFDLAPGAQLYFATGFRSSASFADNIRALRTAGADIIIDDISYFAESPFQFGTPAGAPGTTGGALISQAVLDVTASGALYFSSMGNSGNLDDNTSGVWEGNYVASTTTGTGGNKGAFTFHDFDAGAANQPLNQITRDGGGPFTLHWSDALASSANDYDLVLVDPSGAIVLASTNIQSGTQDPYEAFRPQTQGGNLFDSTGYSLGVITYAGEAPRFLHLATNRGRLQFGTAGESKGHQTVPAAFGIAATPAAASNGAGQPTGPFPNPHGPTNVTETFTSDGPRQIFYNPDGSAITPGNVLAGGGTVVQKPDLTAADGVVTSTPGFERFFGTSASAPHAGAIAALVKSVNPAFNAAQVRTFLNNSAIDIEGTGWDRNSGLGIIDAFVAVRLAREATAIELSSFTVTRVGQKNEVRWTTSSEQDTYGFRVMRSSEGRRDSAVEATPEVILAQHRGTLGGSYSWVDPSAVAGTRYTYWLVEIETSGKTNEYGPAVGKYRTFLPSVLSRSR